MPKYYAVGGVIDLLKPKTGFFGGIEGFYQKASYSFLTHSLYQNFRSRSGENPDNQKISQIYLFETFEDAITFSNSRENKAYADDWIARSPVFLIDTNNFFEFHTSRLAEIPFPDDSFKKKVEKIQKEISWTTVDSAEFDKFRKDWVIEEIYLPGYVRNDKGIYYQEHIEREANRSLFDLNWWLVLGFTFWTCFIVPIAYTIGRLVNRYDAETILQNIDQPFNFELTREKWRSADDEYKSCIQKFELPGLKKYPAEGESLLSSIPFHNPNQKINSPETTRQQDNKTTSQIKLKTHKKFNC